MRMEQKDVSRSRRYADCGDGAKRMLETASSPLVLEFKPRFSDRTEEFL